MPITIEINIDDKGTVTGVRKIKQELDGLDKSAAGSDKSVSALNSTLLAQAKTILPAVTAGWVAYKALGISKEIMAISARYETLGVVMTTVGKNAGYNNIQMQEFQKGLEKAGISMVSSRQSLTMMAQAQIDLAKSSQLARVAQDAAVIGNINSSEAFERLIHGIQAGQVEILRTIGLNVNFQSSYERVAKETGRTADSLSEAEKATIRMNVALEAGAKIAGTYEAAMGTAGKQALSLTRHFEDMKVLIGENFLEEYASGIKAITNAVSEMNEHMRESKENIKAIEWLTKEGIKPSGTERKTVAGGRLGVYNVPAYTPAQIQFGLNYMGIDRNAGKVPTSPGLVSLPGLTLEELRKQFKESVGYGRSGGMAAYGRPYNDLQSVNLGRFSGGVQGLDESRTSGYTDLGGLRLGSFGNAGTEFGKLGIEYNKKKAEEANKAAEEITEKQGREIERMESQMLRMADFWGSMMERMVDDSGNAFDVIGDMLKSLAIRSTAAGVINTLFNFTPGGFGGGAMKFLSNTFGFAGGGYTGYGNSGSIAGYVHKGEYVMSKPVVDQYGPGFFDKLVSAMKEGGGRNNVTINQSFSPAERRNMMALDDDAFAERIIRVARLRKI